MNSSVLWPVLNGLVALTGIALIYFFLIRPLLKI